MRLNLKRLPDLGGRSARKVAAGQTHQWPLCGADCTVIQYHIKEQPNIAVTYFIPDDKKAGGRYVTVSGNVRKLDGLERVIMMVDGTRIPIEDVRMIEGDLFRLFE